MTRRITEGQWKVQFAREDQGEGALRNQHNHEPKPNFHGSESYPRWWRKILGGGGAVEEWVGHLPTAARITASKIKTFFRVEVEQEKDIIPRPQANQPCNLPQSLALLVNPHASREGAVDSNLSQELNLVHDKVQAAETFLKLEKRACQDGEQKTKTRLGELEQEKTELDRQSHALEEQMAALQRQKTAMAQERIHHEQRSLSLKRRREESEAQTEFSRATKKTIKSFLEPNGNPSVSLVSTICHSRSTWLRTERTAQPMRFLWRTGLASFVPAPVFAECVQAVGRGRHLYTHA